MKEIDKIRHLLKHYIEHTEEHAKEFEDLANRLMTYEEAKGLREALHQSSLKLKEIIEILTPYLE
ncbi:MAG: hypothetical protein ACK4UR_00220 [Caldimicrobium sp.]